jgi:hypothetical protein
MYEVNSANGGECVRQALNLAEEGSDREVTLFDLAKLAQAA